MKVKVRKILLCVFFALFIVTLFTASFSLGRYSSVQSSESNYDDDFEYTLYDSIVVNTIDEFFAAISNGYNYIIIGDAIKDPLIIAGSMSDIRDDLIIDLNGHEIQRNSRDPLLNVTTGFTLTIIDSERTGSMYNPVGSVIQVSGGTLTVQNGIFESGPRSDDSRNGDSAVNYNEYVQTNAVSGELYSTPGGGSISATNGTREVTVCSNSYIGKTDNSSGTYIKLADNVSMPIITPKTTGRGVVNGSMYFDDAEEERIYYTCNEYNVIKDDTYLYYTFESDNMQYSEAADKSTANYYYQYYVEGGALDENGNYPSGYFNYVGTERKGTDDIRVTVYVFNDVKYYAAEQSGYKDSSGTPGFAAVKMQSGNLYVRGGTYYSYFGKDNTFGVQSTGGLMSVNPTGSNAINFYAYQNGVCVECTVDKPTENEMLNISNGKFYSELGDTVRVTNGNLVIGEGKFTKDVSSSDIQISTGNLQNLTDAELAELYSYNNSVVNISGGKLNINTRATFNVYGSGVTGIRASSQATVNTNNATFNFYGAGNSKLDASFTRGVYTDGGSVTFDGTTNINLAQISVDGQLLTSRYNVGVLAGNDGTVIFNGSSSITVGGNTNPSGGNYGIYSTGGGITCGQDSNSSTTIKIAENSASTGNYGIYSGGGSIATYGKTEITLGNTANLSTSNYGIYSSGGTVTLGSVNSQSDQATITVNGNSSSSSNFGIQTIGGTINVSGNTEITVYGKSSTGVYSTVDDDDVTTKIVDNKEISIATGGNISISGKQFTCNVNMHWQGENDSIDYANNLSSTAISSAGGNIEINSDQVTINSDGLGITAFNRRMDANGRPINENLFNEVTDESNNTTSYIGTGNVDFEGENVDLTTVRGTAIYILGGALSTSTNSTIDVTSTIVDNLPWQGESGDPYSYDGIYVQSGSLISSGTFNVNHTGVANDDVRVAGGDNANIDSGYEYRDFKIKSFAVRVEGAAGTVVQLNAGTLQNAVGGGLYVSGGSVTLGNENPQLGDISITTKGTSYSGDHTVAGHEGSNWHAPVPITGGHAVQVNGGSLTIYNGTYQSALGNGILVSNGTVNIRNGKFDGTDYTTTVGGVAGAAANYGFKMYGGIVNIYNGTFSEGKSGSGAFVMGTDTIEAQANIYGGSFDVVGQAGFSVYQYANVTFGKEGDPNDKITVKGLAAGLTIETTPNGGAPTVTINAGEFSSKSTVNDGSGVWYGNGSAKLTITGGQFTGTSKSGLYVDNAITAQDAIKISNGTFTGPQAGLWLNAALKANHAIVITGGNFNGTNTTAADDAGGNYGAYYGVDGGGGNGDNHTRADHADDGLLIMGGTFVGKIAGFYFNDNPWSKWKEDTWVFPDEQDYNNVAIVAGTFKGGSKAIGDASNNQVKVGDVLTMHIAYTDGNTTYNHYGYAAGVNGNAGGGGGGAVNDIGTSVTLTMQPK